MPAMRPTRYQERILRMPEECNLLLAGGRGGGKSVAIMLLMLRHIVQYGPLARVILVRETYEAIEQLYEQFESMVSDAFGPGAVKTNKTEGSFTFPNGGIVRMGQLQEQKHYKKYQGKSYTLLIVDEYGELTNPKWVALLASNLRGPKGVPKRIVYAANPGGAQHGNLHYNYICKAAAWEPFEQDGEFWAVCPSTWRDNPTIDQADYLKKLKKACGNDEALFKAWDEGDWNIARGAYFGGVLDENTHKLKNDRFPVSKLDTRWNPYIAMDWGSGAPSVTYVCAESPGVDGFPKGSLLLLDELATYDPGDTSFNTGLHWGPDKLGERVKALCSPWGCPPEGVGDDAYGLEESLLSTFASNGIYLIKPHKERVAGWQVMRNMLVSVTNRDGGPGLWIAERCKYFWHTVPFLQRDDSYPEDIITKGVPDHGADAARYGVLHRNRQGYSGGISGNH